MRIYLDCYELMSEILREVYEMGHEVQPASMQNVDVSEDDNFLCKEIINYSYCLKTLGQGRYLFNDANSKIWADAEFGERVSGINLNPGRAWIKRREVWEQFLNDKGKFHYTYSERMYHQLPHLISELKENPNTRHAILTIWNSRIDTYRLGGKSRVPCSVYYQFLIRDNKLHIIYQQRSCDAVTHMGNDIYLAWKLMEWMAKQVGVEHGYLYHNIASLHAYKRDWPKLKICIDRAGQDK